MTKSHYSLIVLLSVVAVLLLAVLTAGEVRAKSTPVSKSCFDGSLGLIERQIEETYQRNFSIPITHVDLVGDRLVVFMAALNRNPPRSRIVADRAVVFLSPTEPNAVVLFGQEDCVIKMASIPLLTTLFWMRGKVLNTGYQSRVKPLTQRESVVFKTTI